VAGYRLLIGRTKAGATQHYIGVEMPLLNSRHIQNSNMDPKYWQDTRADADLITPYEPPEVGREPTVPPKTTAMCSHNGRMVYAGKSTVYYSLPDANTESLEGVPRTNSIAIGGRTGGSINALYSQGDKLYVFRESGVYQIEGAFEDSEGLPTLRQSTLIEFDAGAQSQSAISQVGGVMVGFSHGKLYAIFGGTVFTEIGRDIAPRYRTYQKDRRYTLSWDRNQDQLHILSYGPSVTTSNFLSDFDGDRQYTWHILDVKQFAGAVQQDSTVVFSRQIFEGAFFPWQTDVNGAVPTHGSTNFGDEMYFVANQGESSVSNSGIYKRIPLDHTFTGATTDQNAMYQDSGNAIVNSVTFTPAFGEVLDQYKTFKGIKVWRFRNSDEILKRTRWSAVIDLFYNFSNNYNSATATIQTDSGTITFSESEDTQRVVDISGKTVTGLEVKLTASTLYESMDFTRMVLDYFSEYDIEDLNITALD
jgi:hypothetical protein